MTPTIRCTYPTPCGRCWYCLEAARDVSGEIIDVPVHRKPFANWLPHYIAAIWRAWGGPRA